MGWGRAFEDPIPLPDGRRLETLESAADYIMALPEAEQAKKHWQTAIEILIGTAEDRDFLLHARIAVMRALNHDRPTPEATKRSAKAFKIIF